MLVITHFFRIYNYLFIKSLIYAYGVLSISYVPTHLFYVVKLNIEYYINANPIIRLHSSF